MLLHTIKFLLVKCKNNQIQSNARHSKQWFAVYIEQNKINAKTDQVARNKTKPYQQKCNKHVYFLPRQTYKLHFNLAFTPNKQMNNKKKRTSHEKNISKIPQYFAKRD